MSFRSAAPSRIFSRRSVAIFATAAMAIAFATTASPASAAVTAPLCPGTTTDVVNPADVQLTPAQEASYNAGNVVLLYGNYGDNNPTPPLGPDTLSPECAVRSIGGQPVSAWAYCTDAYERSCRNNGTPDPALVTQNPKFDPATDALGPDKEKVIVYLLEHGFPVRSVVGALSPATTADDASSESRQNLQLLAWCVSEAGPGNKTATTNPLDGYLYPICTANFTDADFDAVLALVPAAPALTVTPQATTVQPGDTARFDVATNLAGHPINLTATGADGALTICGGAPATLVGSVLTVSGVDTTVSNTVTLCATRAAAGALVVSADAVPNAPDNLIWAWNGVTDTGNGIGCQVFATFNDVAPQRLTDDATVAVETATVPTVPTTPTTPTTPTAPGGGTAAETVSKQRLRITKTSNGKTFKVGQRITYTIRVTNPSKSTVRNVSVCDTLPSGEAFVKASPTAKLNKGRYCWTVSALSAGSTNRFTLTARVLNGAPSRVTNRVSASSADALTGTASRTVTIKRSAAKAGGVTG